MTKEAFSGSIALLEPPLKCYHIILSQKTVIKARGLFDVSC